MKDDGGLRTEVMRRLGGPVCTVCDRARLGIDYWYIHAENMRWLAERGKQDLARVGSHLQMCRECIETMARDVRAKKMEDDMNAHLVGLRLLIGEQEYRAMHSAHHDDLDAASDMCVRTAVTWLFGGRGE